MEPDYFDIELDLKEIASSSSLDDLFYLKDLQQRKLFLSDDICQLTVDDIVKRILQYNSDDKGKPVEERKPILLYLSSNGGDVGAGFCLIDAITNSKTPVYTINMSNQYSMGFLIGIAGKKRFSSPNATFLLHDGTNFIYATGSKARDTMEFNDKFEAKIKDYVLRFTKITNEEYEANRRKEWYMFAEDAKRYGVTDYIIGIDCDPDEIV